MPLDIAEGDIISAGLILGTVTEQYHPTVPVGLVIEQSPTAGVTVERGTEVNLIISLGPEPVFVPDVVGMEQSTAENAILAEGLLVGALTEQYHELMPAGMVISQEPVAGTSVLPGTLVSLVIRTRTR